MDIKIAIGRGVEGANVILVPSSLGKVSRCHAIIYWHDGIVTIEDQSTNGTFVNGSRITKTRIYEDDIIWLGGFGADCYRIDVEKVFDFCRKAGDFQYNNGPQQNFKTNQDAVETYTFDDQKKQQTQQTDDDKPDNYLGLAIVTVLFNLIFGIVAIIYSVRVNKLWNKGDRAGAEKASKNARGCCIAGLILGVIGIIRILLFIN